MNPFAKTPTPPYYAAIFTSARTPGDGGYGEAAEHMVALASTQPGFLGVESVRDAQGVGITVSYWESEQAIAAWKANSEHAAIREKGRRDWYQHFELRVAKVERAYSMPARKS